MRWSDLPRDPSTRQLREFAGLALGVFGALALWNWFGRGEGGWAGVFAALALGIGPLGLVWPRAVRPVFVGWMILAFPIGWLISNAVLAVVYYGVVTPIGLVFRIRGRDPLRRQRPDGVNTYWTAKPSVRDPARYLRQY
jgi:hypothetical protein